MRRPGEPLKGMRERFCQAYVADPKRNGTRSAQAAGYAERQDRTIEEVLEANPLSVYHDDYNWQFITTERMTRTLYRALTTGE